jgi:hypothetical protein
MDHRLKKIVTMALDVPPMSWGFRWASQIVEPRAEASNA